MLSLGQKYGIDRLEAACSRAIKHSAVSWKSVQAILKNGLDLQQPDVQRTLDLPEQESLRGAAYYQSSQIHKNNLNGIYRLIKMQWTTPSWRRPR